MTSTKTGWQKSRSHCFRRAKASNGSKPVAVPESGGTDGKGCDRMSFEFRNRIAGTVLQEGAFRSLLFALEL